MNDKEAKQHVKQYCKKILEKRRLEIEENCLTLEQIDMYNSAIGHAGVNNQWIEMGDDVGDESIVARMISSLGLDVKPDTAEYAKLRRWYHEATPDLAKAILKLNEQSHQFDFMPPINAVAVSMQPEELEPRKLNSMIGKYMETQTVGLTQRTIDERYKQFAPLQELLGSDFNLRNLSADDAVMVRDVIVRIPLHVNKNPKTKHLSLLEAVEVKGLERMSTVTANKYIALYASFNEWLLKEHVITGHPTRVNYFATLLGKVVHKERTQREAFTVEQIHLILDELDKRDAGFAKKDYEYWGTLIALYTGARLEEIAQLELDDIKQDNGIWYFDINELGDKKLKNKNAIRKIPVHNALLERGLIEYIDSLKKHKKDRLLHELSYSPRGYGRALGRFCNNRFLPKLRIKKTEIVFHSFRHTFNTTMLNTNAEAMLVQQLLGHEPDAKMTANYAKGGYTIQNLKLAMDRLSYAVSSET